MKSSEAAKRPPTHDLFRDYFKYHRFLKVLLETKLRLKWNVSKFKFFVLVSSAADIQL